MPRVSVVVPAYRSGATIQAALDALARQTYRDYEVIVVESGGEAFAKNAPHIRWLGVEERLLPQAARNHGVLHARGELLVFTDPDIYVAPHWLQSLVDAWDARRDVIIGSFACYGDRYLDFAYHLCKFSKWLPAGATREVDTAPSGNMLVSRADFDRAGTFRGELFVGDVELSRRLQAGGLRLWLEPAAIGAHHPLYSLRAFLAERFQRGIWYGELRASWLPRPRLALLAAATILPVRLITNLAHVARHAMRAHETVRFVTTLPVVALCYGATLAGEARSFLRGLTSSETFRT
jgi:glycosyltransferase involved in cell wall biosynthesis